MPRRTKLFVMALVVIVATSAALFFRKSPPPAAESGAPQPAPAEHYDLAPREKPAPVSHLTGRIEEQEKASNLARWPGSEQRPGTFSTSASGAGGYSPVPMQPADNLTGANPPATSPVQGSVLPGSTYNEHQRHKVADGDTLSSLAVRYLGSADRYREIFELNRDVLSNADLLPIGTELRIPTGTSLNAGPVDRPVPRQMVPISPRT